MLTVGQGEVVLYHENIFAVVEIDFDISQVFSESQRQIIAKGESTICTTFFLQHRDISVTTDTRTPCNFASTKTLYL